MAGERKKGRRKGGRKRGYYYRAGRGWCVMDNGRSVALYDQHGERLTARATPLNVVQDAVERYRQQQAEQRRLATGEDIEVAVVCERFLEYAKRANRAGTYTIRARCLFDFCTGLPARFMDRVHEATAKDKVHAGYGRLRVSELEPRHIAEWYNVRNWTSVIPRQSVIRAFSWAASPEVALIKANPIKGTKVGKVRSRVTYFTPEQEKLLCESANSQLAMVIKVLIRTGCRPHELVQLTAQHVEETSKGQVWRFSPEEHKTGHTGKARIVRVATEVAEIVRELIRKYPEGPLFRSVSGLPWSNQRLRDQFSCLKRRLIEKGHKFSADDCLYSTRHTFAKRMLGGYWTGKPATIETVAGAMGNSRQVAWETYGKWCESYDDPLWEALG